MECIVLAGGLGTRLRSEVEDLPKCMAPVNGLPFLEYVFQYLESQFVDHVVLSLGYKHEAVTDWLNGKAFTFKIERVLEAEPMGTGGGIKLALRKCTEAQTFILNGDTLFKADLHAMKAGLQPTDKAVLALKRMEKFDRYGAVRTDADNRVIAFEEKKYCEQGLINGGVYLLNNALVNPRHFPDKFSFEKDFLEPEAANRSLRGYEDEGYFIDIGIPEDFRRAQKELGG